MQRQLKVKLSVAQVFHYGNNKVVASHDVRVAVGVRLKPAIASRYQLQLAGAESVSNARAFWD